MTEILVLPIDDRPCHNEFITEATKYLDDYKIKRVPKHLLGHFTEAGDTAAISEYLMNHGKTADVLILSVDSLLYGGLVQARTMNPDVDLNHYDHLLDTLRQLKRANPKLQILAYSVIVRLTTTVTSSDELSTWEDIFEYSQLLQRSQIDKSYAPRLSALEARIPRATLQDYLEARKRNHTFNAQCIRLVKEGILDYLALVQEDTNMYGMHVTEQEALKSMIDEAELNDSVVIKNGTDEMVALLLARVLNKHTQSFQLDTQFVDPTYIAKFEDKTILENIDQAFRVANLKHGDANSRDVFLVLPADGDTVDLAFEPKLDSDVLTKQHLDWYQRYADSNLYVLDIKYGNGGDIRALDCILNALPSANLKGYSAWNTGSNAIGTLVLDLIIGMYYTTNPQYLKYRIIDDALYQGDVRPLMNDAFKKRNYDVWAPERHPEMDRLATELLNREIVKHAILEGTRIDAILPWGRTFEVLLKENENE